MDCKSFELQIKSLDETGTFEGRLSVYNNVDEAGEIIEPGAFSKSLREAGSQVPLLWSHDPREPIGTLELHDSPTALFARGKLVLSVPRARQAYELMRAGALKGLSVGYRVIRDTWSGSTRRLKELRLYEGSVTPVPANREAVITAVKAQGPRPDLEVLEAFRSAHRELKDFHRRLIDGE